jgi:glycerol-3-phosphate dehydrogenase
MRGDFTHGELDALAADRYDLLVVGGGIHGLFAAYDAALRGLTVALVERADFGSGLSFNHQRTIHGGLRALQAGQVAKTREEIRERRTWAIIAPHLVRPLPFIIGTYRWTMRARTALRAGFAAYDFLGRRRNWRVAPELHLPKARLESAAATRRLFPGVSEGGLSGGAIWYDYQTVHPDRLVWTVALAAAEQGARLANHTEAIAPLREDGRVAGMRVRDGLTGREVDVRAASTLLAAGTGLGRLLTLVGAAGAPPLVRAMNVLVDRPARDIAMAARGASGRMLTAVPWRGRVLIGTHQSAALIDHEETRPPVEAVEAFLSDLNQTFPVFKVGRQDVRLIHHGLTPAETRGGRANLLPEPRVTRHASQGLPGLVSLVGVKYTTSRLAAERAIDAVCVELQRPKGHCRTGVLELPFAGVADVEGRLLETLGELNLTLDRDVLAHLASWYGTEASDVIRHAGAAGLLERLSSDAPVLTGEVSYAVDRGAARRLGDAVLRRTPLGSAGHPGRGAIDRAAAIMAARLHWDDARRDHEIAAVEAVYPAALFTADRLAIGRC